MGIREFRRCDERHSGHGAGMVRIPNFSITDWIHIAANFRPNLLLVPPCSQDIIPPFPPAIPAIDCC